MRDHWLTHKFEKNPPANAESLGFIFVDGKFQLIICAIAKVENATMKTIFAQLYNKTWRGEDVHFWTLGKKGDMGLKPLYNYTEERRAIRLKTYLKFPFVGEPLNRLLSAFKDKFIGNRTSLSRSTRDKIAKSYRPRNYISNGENVVTFLEFMKYYSHYRMRDHYWRQYEKICHPCLVNYDFIGKLETLSEDGPSLLKVEGIRDRVAFPPIHQHTRGDEVLKYYSKVPPDDTKQIGELYFSNFAMFGYEFLGPVKSNVKNS